MIYLCYIIFTLKRYPTKAVSPMATVPQKAILKIDFPMFEPPVLADNAPKTIRKNSAKP